MKHDQPRMIFLRYLSCHVCALLLLTSNSIADISADSVVVLANKNSSASKRVAEHYAEKRGLSKKQIIVLDIPVQETISQKLFDSSVRSVLRTQLEERGLAEKTRVVVSTFDIPIRVAAPDKDSTFHQFRIDALRRRDLVRKELYDELVRLQKIDGTSPSKPDEVSTDQQLAKALQTFLQKLVEQPPPTANRSEQTQIVSTTVQKIAGLAGLSQLLRADEGNEQAQQFLDQQRQFVQATIQQLTKLERLGASQHRELVYHVTAIVFGGIGVLGRANKEMSDLTFEDADASFDSELSLLWWDSDMYPLSKRVPNPWFLGSKNTQVALPILMLSRLDGPTHEVAMGLVDRALTAEANGLAGGIFVDARGLSSPGDEYFSMDERLRTFGEKMRSVLDSDSGYIVHIDNNEALLTEAKNAALYVGWYSLEKFVGEFDFVPGAIGYHIASAEAKSVRDPNSSGWCKGLLQSGITATLGSIAEPFLDSFPEPEHFFGLMMTGNYSLVEAYYLSSRFLSWRMTLFGDPLYNPWRGRPAIATDALKSDSGALPTPLGDFDFAEAFSRRKELMDERAAIVKALQSLVDAAKSKK